MSGTTPALFAAAAGVGFGHAILPDHWVPLAVLGRARRYPLSKVARLSGLAGVAHVLLSIVLGAVIIAVGLQFRSTVQSVQDTIIGCLLIATGVGFALFELTGRGHSHDHSGHGHRHDHPGDGHRHDHPGDGHRHDHPGDDHRHEHDHHHHHGAHEHEARGIRGLAAVMVPFGAAASPDLTILPVFLAATAVGVPTAIGSLAIFAAVTIGTIVGLTLTAARGGYQVHGQWLDRWGNGITAVVLVVIGALVLTGTI
jgi:hypothetical protein